MAYILSLVVDESTYGDKILYTNGYIDLAIDRHTAFMCLTSADNKDLFYECEMFDCRGSKCRKSFKNTQWEHCTDCSGDLMDYMEDFVYPRIRMNKEDDSEDKYRVYIPEPSGYPLYDDYTDTKLVVSLNSVKTIEHRIFTT